VYYFCAQASDLDKTMGSRNLQK